MNLKRATYRFFRKRLQLFENANALPEGKLPSNILARKPNRGWTSRGRPGKILNDAFSLFRYDMIDNWFLITRDR